LYFLGSLHVFSFSLTPYSSENSYFPILLINSALNPFL
jgi:hypothetical protein